MRAVVQRVARASVAVDGEVVGRVERGLLVLLGVMEGDSEREAEWMADRIAGYRVFEDETGRMNRSVTDVGGGCLVVSQFTLAADGRKGRRPSFDRAAEPETARVLYQSVSDRLSGMGLTVEQGRFGAKMAVELLNDGPATFVLETLPAPG